MRKREQTFLARMVDGNGNVKDFYRFDCKRVSTVENKICKAMTERSTGLQGLFRRDWMANDIVACEIYRTPDGVHAVGKPERRVIMDFAADMKLRDYYQKNFPEDLDGAQIDENATFQGLFEALDMHQDVYDYIGFGDSIIRERLFSRLSKVMGVSYEEVYRQWLGL